jgi:catechol 2,3-dioxygenase-like lactoylglutathione lyase family enzyme
MGYHHLALAARDMQAIHDFYEGVLGFELVKVETQPVPDIEGAWAKHFFYRMEDDSKFIAFWELHGLPEPAAVETDLNAAAGLPPFINHISFDVVDAADLNRRRAAWQNAGLDVLEIDHNWCRSIYTRDPNGNLVEFCLTTGSFTEADRAEALARLRSDEAVFSKPHGAMTVHKATNGHPV